MPRYYNDHSFHKQHRFIKRSYLILLSIVLIVALAALLVYIDNFIRNRGNTKEETTSEVTTSYFAPTTKIFRTEYFQFQANKSWSEAANETTSGKYVYRSMRGSLIEHEVIIYVNREPDKLPVTHVLPVNLKVKRSELLPITISEHCGKELPTSQKVDGPITLDEVTFLCSPNDSRYTAMVGVVGGGTDLVLSRPNGSEAKYVIYYSNVTATADASQLVQIASTFQTR